MDYFTTLAQAMKLKTPIKNFEGHAYRLTPSYTPKKIDDLLGLGDVNQIIAHFEEDSKFYDVGVQGLPSNTEIGSRRVTVYDEGFSTFLTSLLHPFLKPILLDDYSPVDWQSQNPDKLNYWVPLGISTLFRYMRYRNGSQHYTHYDAPFIHPENPLIRTLQSGVLYLTNSQSCKTAFVDDRQQHMPFSKRSHKDWERETHLDEIVEMFPSVEGSALLFFHQLPHFVTKHSGDNDRIIIRFDVTYQAIGRI